MPQNLLRPLQRLCSSVFFNPFGRRPSPYRVTKPISSPESTGTLIVSWLHPYREPGI